LHFTPFVNEKFVIPRKSGSVSLPPSPHTEDAPEKEINCGFNGERERTGEVAFWKKAPQKLLQTLRGCSHEVTAF
jgi:hypothetical protein